MSLIKPSPPPLNHSPLEEPPFLTYLRERWLEDHSGEVFDSSSSDEDEVNPLLLNPTQWKDQDHYAILGLGKLRYRATVQDLKKACKCVSHTSYMASVCTCHV